MITHDIKFKERVGCARIDTPQSISPHFGRYVIIILMFRYYRNNLDIVILWSEISVF